MSTEMMNDANALRPKLRFPEFENGTAWKSTPLGLAFGRITNGKANVQDHEEGGAYPLFDRSEEIKASNNFAFDSEALILPGEGVAFKPRYFKGKFNLHQRAYALMNCEGHAPFFYYGLEFAKQKLAEKAVKSTVLSLRLPIIENFAIPAPDYAEQLKVAACLTSLDNLIAAEERRLESLRAHKKALMQNLFPREGESRPRLRFLEFHDARDWKERRLGQLGTLVPGLTYSPSDVSSGGLLVLRSSNIRDGKIALDDCVYVSPCIRGANLARPNDILICIRNGSKALIGKNALIPNEMPLCTHGAFMTVVRSNAPYFVFQLLQTSEYRKQVAADLGATINSINGTQLLKYRFVAPDVDEQQRIANCLCSLDVLNAAQSQRLSALRTLKSGLMQQLFPSVRRWKG